MNQAGKSGAALSVRIAAEPALSGEVSPSAFRNEVPEYAYEDPLIVEIVEDIEEAITHVPARGFRGGLDIEKWQASDDYWNLRVNLEALDAISGGASDELVRVARSSALAADFMAPGADPRQFFAQLS